MAIDYATLDQFRVECSIKAAREYNVPESIILAIADIEKGQPGQMIKNKNGTYDAGYMQFNTTYLNSLSKYGITLNHVLDDSCYSFYLAAWRIAKHISDDKNDDVWEKVSNYHSRNKKFNLLYKNKLINKVEFWDKWYLTNYNVNTLKDVSVEMIPKMPRVALSKNIPPTPQIEKTLKQRDSPHFNNQNLSEKDQLVYAALKNSSKVKFNTN